MELEAERHFPDESGGVLLGYSWPGRRGRIEVISQVGPGPKARHQRRRFEPDGAWQDAKISAAYEASGRVLTYLGDWHSHPRGGGSPSRLDTRTAREIAGCVEARLAHPLLVIIHGEPGRWKLAPHRLRRRRLGRVRFKVVDPEGPAR